MRLQAKKRGETDDNPARSKSPKVGNKGNKPEKTQRTKKGGDGEKPADKSEQRDKNQKDQGRSDKSDGADGGDKKKKEKAVKDKELRAMAKERDMRSAKTARSLLRGTFCKPEHREIALALWLTSIETAKNAKPEADQG